MKENNKMKLKEKDKRLPIQIIKTQAKEREVGLIINY